MCICDEKYAIGYSIAISSKTIILGFMQPVSSLYKIYDLSSFVFDHNSTKIPLCGVTLCTYHTQLTYRLFWK